MGRPDKPHIFRYKGIWLIRYSWSTKEWIDAATAYVKKLTELGV